MEMSTAAMEVVDKIPCDVTLSVAPLFSLLTGDVVSLECSFFLNIVAVQRTSNMFPSWALSLQLRVITYDWQQ